MTNADRKIIQLLAENALLREKVADLEALAQSDSLTQCGNRRAFDTALKKELERSRRSGYPTCLILLDIDGLKRINDAYGHSAGDSCLIELARVLVSKVRKLDSVHRIGGDEFAIVLAASTVQAGSIVAQRLQSASLAINHSGELLSFSFSIGVASADSEGISVLDSALNPAFGSAHRVAVEGVTDQLPARLLAAADEALYQSKAQNR